MTATEQAVPDYEALIEKHTEHLILKFGCRVRDPQLRWTQIQDTIRAACTEAISLHKQWAYNKIKEYLEADRGSNNGIKDQTSDPVHQGD